jgi:hypothetical protein
MMGELHTIVYDQNDKPFVLLATRLKSVNGSRYATRASIAKVFEKTSDHVMAGSAHPNAKKQWHAMANRFKLRIGCRVFRQPYRDAIEYWATFPR